MSRTLLMSLRPKHAASVFNGFKLFEYRRTRVNVLSGDRVLLYESAPVSCVTGEFVVGCVRIDDPDALYRLEPVAEIRELVRAYLAGARQATAIEVTQPRRWAQARAVREVIGRDRPPQSYLFVREQ